MKYIRTKDGIYETIGKEQLCMDGEIEVFCTKHNSVAKSWIIKQADTIEELCDRFVIEYKDHNEQRILKTFMRVEMAFLKQQRYELHQIKAIYGAIWTDKGLIYVAKMNDKGELELL